MFVYLVGGLPHELFCLLSPYGRDGDHPTDFVHEDFVPDRVGQLAERVIQEVAQSAREHDARGNSVTVGGADGCRAGDLLEQAKILNQGSVIQIFSSDYFLT